MSYNLIWVGSDVIVRFSDVITVDDILDADNKIYGDNRFDTMQFQIFDFLDVKINKLTSDNMMIISTLDFGAARWNDRVKVACIATDNHMVEMIDFYSKGIEGTGWVSKTFSDIDSAKKWCLE